MQRPTLLTVNPWCWHAPCANSSSAPPGVLCNTSRCLGELFIEFYENRKLIHYHPELGLAFLGMERLTRVDYLCCVCSFVWFQYWNVWYFMTLVSKLLSWKTFLLQKSPDQLWLPSSQLQHGLLLTSDNKQRCHNPDLFMYQKENLLKMQMSGQMPGKTRTRGHVSINEPLGSVKIDQSKVWKVTHPVHVWYQEWCYQLTFKTSFRVSNFVVSHQILALVDFLQ